MRARPSPAFLFSPFSAGLGRRLPPRGFVPFDFAEARRQAAIVPGLMLRCMAARGRETGPSRSNRPVFSRS